MSVIDVASDTLVPEAPPADKLVPLFLAVRKHVSFAVVDVVERNGSIERDCEHCSKGSVVDPVTVPADWKLGGLGIGAEAMPSSFVRKMIEGRREDR